MDPATKKVLWTYRSAEPIDSRALCVSTGRIFVYSHGKYLACVESASGKELWKTTDEKLLAAIGQHDRAQTASKGFASSAYAKANEKGVYFAGPQRTNLVGVSAVSGSLMWSYPHGNFQLVLRDDALYAMGRMETSKKFDYVTGQVLADLDCYRGNCTRATATADSIFTRGYRHTGTMRLDVAGNDPRRIALMRPACQDGVIIANGQLYWGPWMCDCNHSLIGMISLAPSGGQDVNRPAVESERLEAVSRRAQVGLPSDDLDWPGYRGGSTRAALSQRIIPSEVEEVWRLQSPSKAEPTAPIAVGSLVFWSGHDGVVTAVQANSGKVAWTAFTDGAVRFSPEFEGGKLYVGSGDGRVHCLEAGSGRALWRFRAAPADRKILVHGKILSNWPVGSGVLVAGGTVYAAAGITSYDGTHVFALDAATGEINWQNNTSSELAGETRSTGVSVQGHLLLHDKKLYLAGGNVVSPAVYDLDDGRCLNKIKGEWIDSYGETDQRFPKNGDSKMFHRSPRGRELFVVDGEVRVFDQLLYSPPKYGPSRYFGGHFLQAGSDKTIVRGTTNRVVRLSHLKTDKGEPIGVWQTEMFRDPAALAVCKNAVVVAGELAPESEGAGDTEQAPSPKFAVAALRFDNGEPLWSKPLPAAPVSWGLAIDRRGRSIVTLIDGSVVCLGPSVE
jgi:outer membrane protein assembly factor BamB